MNWLDIVILIPFVWYAVKGFSAGFIKSLAKLVALVAGIYFSIHFSDYVAAYIIKHVELNQKYVFILAYIITFSIVVMIVSILGSLLDKIASLAALGLLNKFLGMVFGMITSALIISSIIFLINIFDRSHTIIKDEAREKSIFYQPVSAIVPWILKNFDFREFSLPDSEREDKGNPEKEKTEKLV